MSFSALLRQAAGYGAARRSDRAKRQRKAKLRACLKKKGVEKLPSTSSASGQRLSRHVKQSINRAVNQFFNDHPDHDVVLEDLSVSTMRFKSRRMNAYLYASQLGHIPDQIEWVAEKRQQLVITVNPAYSSQECPVCHFTDRQNRPNQQTFCCQACGHSGHADEVASQNLARRRHDDELEACEEIADIKALLMLRHQHWRQGNGCLS
jgi:IS605 OrfB family transposase